MNWIISKVLGFAGKKLDGYGTKIAGVCFILLGVAGLAGTMFPDQGLPETSVEMSLGFITAGIAAIRGRKAVSKVEEKMDALSAQLVQQRLTQLEVPVTQEQTGPLTASPDKEPTITPGPPSGSGGFLSEGR